jgi:hypothetical protein
LLLDDLVGAVEMHLVDVVGHRVHRLAVAVFLLGVAQLLE